MVGQFLAGLAGTPGLELHHVNARVSTDAADIGTMRPGKLAALARHIGAARRLQRKHGLDTLYYVPAPGRRGALLRDWMVMASLRPRFPKLVLHWHAAGLAEWLRTCRSRPEQALTRRLLGQADLSIVLGENLRDDAVWLQARRIAVLRNGIPDPCPRFIRPPRDATQPLQAVFLGMCHREKGLFDALEGVALAHRQSIAAGGPGVRLAVAGEFAAAGTREAFDKAAAGHGLEVKIHGFLDDESKDQFLAEADLLLFPTYYPHETQGLVMAEAMAHDLPIVATRWRAVHEGLPERHLHLVEPRQPEQIAARIGVIAREGVPGGALRAHFLAHYTLDRHLAGLRAALDSIEA